MQQPMDLANAIFNVVFALSVDGILVFPSFFSSVLLLLLFLFFAFHYRIIKVTQRIKVKDLNLWCNVASIMGVAY